MAGSTVFHGGRVFTGRRWVDALAVEDGKVLAAGTDAEVRRAAPSGERISLDGRNVVPGLIDAHLHLGGMALERLGVDLGGVRSEREIADRCRTWAAAHSKGPVVGRGWDHTRMEGGTYPTRASLDRAFPDREVVLFRVCGHAALVNGRAMEAAGITDATDEPAGGRILHDAQGSPTGVLLDAAMGRLGGVKGRALAAHPEALETTLRAASACGLTSVASMSASATEVRDAVDRATAAPLPVRVRFYVELAARGEFERRPRSWADDAVRVSGVKAITDGSFGAHTAWLADPYDDRPGEVGLPVGSTDALADEIAVASELGLQVALHAIGDRAIYRALRLLQLAYGGPTPRIEHASLVTPNLYSLLDRVRPHLVVQPRFVVSDWWIADRLGAERARHAYAFRTLLERGYRLGGSSDAPVEAFDPWTGIAAAVRRGSVAVGGALPPPEALSPEAALALYTAGAGAALEEGNLGTLEVGAPADLLVLRSRSLDAALELGSAAIEETWLGGTRVLRSEGAGSGGAAARP